MTARTRSLRRAWKSVDLRVVFHTFRNGKPRPQPLPWAPHESTAQLHDDPARQSVVLTVHSETGEEADNVTVDLMPQCIGLSRDGTSLGWRVIGVEDDKVTILIGDTRIEVRADGSVVRTCGTDKTFLEADGSVLRQGAEVEAIVSADGLSLSRRTPDMIAAITPEGVIARVAD